MAAPCLGMHKSPLLKVCSQSNTVFFMEMGGGGDRESKRWDFQTLLQAPIGGTLKPSSASIVLFSTLQTKVLKWDQHLIWGVSLVEATINVYFTNSLYSSPPKGLGSHLKPSPLRAAKLEFRLRGGYTLFNSKEEKLASLTASVPCTLQTQNFKRLFSARKSLPVAFEVRMERCLIKPCSYAWIFFFRST